MIELVLTIIGRDRAGVVAALADVVRFHDGNWKRSELAEIAGVFAGNLDVVDGDRFAQILVDDEPNKTQFMGIESEVPFGLVDFCAGKFANQGGPRRRIGQVEVGFLEGD